MLARAKPDAARSILMENLPGESRAAILDEDGRAIALLLERDTGDIVPGDIYRARVEKIVPGLGGFLDLGPDGAGFLPENALRAVPDLSASQTVVLQATRPPRHGKAAEFSPRIVLAGMFLAYAPAETGDRLSRRLAGAAGVAGVKDGLARLADLRAGLALASVEGGFTLRLAGFAADLPTLRGEAGDLIARWQAATGEAGRGGAPGRLIASPPAAERVFRDILARTGGVRPLTLVGPAPAGDLVGAGKKARALGFAPQAGGPNDGARLADIFDAALAPRVSLASGAALEIDETALGVTIDLDRGRAAGTAATINREAAAAVMRETACRGLGGLIVIDFLRLSSKAARAALFAAMQEECAAAGLSVRPHGFTRAGLFEMTAERARLSLLEQMACRERTGPGGWRIRDESLAFALMRRVLAEAAADPGRPPRVTAAAKICLCLEGKLRSSWSAVAARSGARLVAGGADWPHDRIDITR